jgi:hypothetical protein
MTKNIFALALVAVLALAGIVVYYTDSHKSNQSNVAPEQHVQQVESQVQPSETDQAIARSAYIDPTTGELLSQPAQSTQELQPASIVQGTDNLPPVKITTHSNGMVQAELNGRFQMPLQATIGCDGKITKEHSNRELSEATNCDAEK